MRRDKSHFRAMRPRASSDAAFRGPLTFHFALLRAAFPLNNNQSGDKEQQKVSFPVAMPAVGFRMIRLRPRFDLCAMIFSHIASIRCEWSSTPFAQHEAPVEFYVSV